MRVMGLEEALILAETDKEVKISQTAADIANRRVDTAGPQMSAKDREIIRRLASRVAELAARPVEEEKRKLWYAHNALEATRPLVFCDPENGWNEILRASDLECEGEHARWWEMHLRKEIFWGSEMKDDRVIEPFFNVGWVATESDWGMDDRKIGGGDGGSYVWESPLKSYDMMDKLHFPVINVDREATQRMLDFANDVLGDILTVRLKMMWWWSIGMTWLLVRLRGLEQMMFDMIDCPDDLHRLMAYLRDGHLAKVDFLEENGLLCLNNDGTYVGSGGFGWTKGLPQAGYEGKVRTQDMWGFCESQETLGISNDMFEEFVFQYQLPVLERFGLNCYGCCEPLDRRWPVVKKAPNLRRVSVSAWANVADMAEKLQGDYVFSWKPNPADLAMPSFDEARIRKEMRRMMQTTRDCRVEVIMKDNHTIGGDPTRVTRWVKIAEEEAEAL